MTPLASIDPLLRVRWSIRFESWWSWFSNHSCSLYFVQSQSYVKFSLDLLPPLLGASASMLPLTIMISSTCFLMMHPRKLGYTLSCFLRYIFGFCLVCPRDHTMHIYLPFSDLTHFLQIFKEAFWEHAVLSNGGKLKEEVKKGRLIDSALMQAHT